MKSAIEQLSTYKSVHLNPSNIRTHFIGVPLIIWSVSLFLSLINFDISPIAEGQSISMAAIFFALALVYYFKLHWRLAIGLIFFIVPVFYSTQLLASHDNALWIAAAILVVGWIIQFIGHHYEKAKPAFVDDLNQLVIGPFFLMAELYFMLGFERPLAEKITPMAIEKRRLHEAKKKAALKATN